MKATKWLGFFNTISAYLLPPTAAVVQNNLQSIRPGLLTPRRGLAKRLGSQSGNAVLAMYRKTRATLPDQLITYSFVKALSSNAAVFTFDFYYGVQRTQQDPISLTYTATTVYRDGGKIIQGTISNNSPVVVVTGTSGLAIGDRILGVGIPDDTVIQAIDTNTSVTLSSAATLTTIAGTTQSCQIFPGSVSVPSFAEDRHGRTYMFFGNGIKPQMLRTSDNLSVDVGIESPLAAPGLALALNSMFVERVDVYAGGGNYTQPPRLTFSGGGGATAVAILDGGVISAVEVTAGGANYTSTPIITVVEASTRGTNFSGTALVTTPANTVGLNVSNAALTISAGFVVSNTFASSLSTSGIPTVTQIGPTVTATAAVGTTKLTLPASALNYQIIPGMVITGSGIPANTVVNELIDNVTIIISNAVTTALTATSVSFTNLVALTYDSTRFEYFGYFFVLNTYVSATSTGLGGKARIAFAEAKTGYQIAPLATAVGYIAPKTSGSLNPNGALYVAGAYWNLNNNGFFGLVASQSTYRWGQHTRENYSRDAWAEIWNPGRPAYDGRYRNYYFPNYEFVSVWMHTGLKSSLAIEQWSQQECKVFKLNSTTAYIDVTLLPEQVTDNVPSPLGLNFAYPVIRVYLAYAPTGWTRTYGDPFDYKLERRAVQYQQRTTQGFLGTIEPFPPVVDFRNVQSGAFGWDSTSTNSSFFVQNPGSGMNVNATFLMRFATGVASDQFSIVDRTAYVGSTRAGSARVETGWGANAFDITFTANTLETTSATTSVPGQITTAIATSAGAGYATNSDSASVVLRQNTLPTFANSGTNISVTTTPVSIPWNGATDTITSVTVNSGGANYSGQPTFVLRPFNGSGYGAELSVPTAGGIVNGVITSVNVISGGHGFTPTVAGAAGFPVETQNDIPVLMAVMRPTFKGVYSCAYRYADWTDTVVGTCYVCSDTGAQARGNVILDDNGASIIKTGYVLDGGLFRFHARAVSVIKKLVGLSLLTTNRPSNSTFTITGIVLSSNSASFSVSSANMLAIGMGATHANITTGSTITAINRQGAVLLPVLTSGTITSINILASGVGYTAGTAIVLTGTGTIVSAVAAVTTVDAVGGITSITVTVAGSGYVTATAGIPSTITISNLVTTGVTASVVFTRIQPVVSQIGQLTSGDALVTLLSTIGLQIGQHVRGTGIPDNTYILSLSANVSITLTNPVTVTGSNALQCGWLTTIRDMSRPISYSNFSPISTITAGPTPSDGPTGRLTWSWDANVLTPERAQIVELWRTNGDQSLVFYRSEMFAVATPNTTIVPVANIVAFGTFTTAAAAALAPQNALRGYAAGTTNFDALSDEGLFLPSRRFYAALPVVLPNGGLNAYRFDQPRTDMRVCAAFNDRLWYAVSTSGLDTNTIFFSEYDEFESCPETNALTIQANQKLTDNLTALMPYGSVLLAAQENHIYQLTYSTDPAVDANISMLAHRGLYNQRCWDIYDDEIYCLDRRGVYTMTAQGTVTNICAAVESYWLDNLIESTRSDSFFIKIDSRSAILRAFVVIDDANAPGPNLVLCYSINTKTWWTETYPNSLTASSSYKPESTQIHDDVYSAIDGNIYALSGQNDLGYRSIISVNLTNGGSGYVTAPKVVALSAQGSGAKFQALLKNGVISDILITDRGTDYGILTNLLGTRGQWDTVNSLFVFTATVSPLLDPTASVVLQRYTDITYRVKLGNPFTQQILSIPDDSTPTTRIRFVGTVQNAPTNIITVADTTGLAKYQYLRPLSGVPALSYISAINGNQITITCPNSAQIISNVTNAVFKAYAPKTFITTPITGQSPAWASDGYVAISADQTSIIEQVFNNEVALLIDPPSNSSGTQATAIAICQNPPSEFVTQGGWVFEQDAVGSANGIAVITFINNHTFIQGQQVPIVFLKPDLTASALTHNPNDQNQQISNSGNWYIKAITEKTITVMAKSVMVNGVITETSGRAECTDEGLPYQFLTIGTQYKTGALELVSDDNTPKVGSNFTDRSITILYQPTSESKSLILREYYNNSKAARINQMARNRGTGFIHELNGAQAILDMSITRSALGAATGVAKAIFGSRTAADMSGADTHIAVELIMPSDLIVENTQLVDPPELYGLTINGIVENGSA